MSRFTKFILAALVMAVGALSLESSAHAGGIKIGLHHHRHHHSPVIHGHVHRPIRPLCVTPCIPTYKVLVFDCVCHDWRLDSTFTCLADAELQVLRLRSNGLVTRIVQR